MGFACAQQLSAGALVSLATDWFRHGVPAWVSGRIAGRRVPPYGVAISGLYRS